MIQDLLAIIRGLIDELENLDERQPTSATCYECTLGTVPVRLDKGPCAYHKAKKLLKEIDTP